MGEAISFLFDFHQVLFCVALGDFIEVGFKLGQKFKER
ncbi:hypothetical protein C943_04169 [Mariniradius saccharolyticus AK6]|uniref:Uncharacterized protein n=2 Tax=Mariniradius TaxID=1245590 RepID=M7X8Y5_9BACT|nr:hypothetical protein C943_04169 [Mariniradius saccharolyticus AK6]